MPDIVARPRPFVGLLISQNIRNENKTFQLPLFTHNAKSFTHKLKIS